MARPRKNSEAPSPEVTEMTAQEYDAALRKTATKTVSMVRDEPMFPGGPVTADVHPDEVDNMKRHDWKEA